MDKEMKLIMENFRKLEKGAKNLQMEKLLAENNKLKKLLREDIASSAGLHGSEDSYNTIEKFLAPEDQYRSLEDQPLPGDRPGTPELSGFDSQQHMALMQMPIDRLLSSARVLANQPGIDGSTLEELIVAAEDGRNMGSGEGRDGLVKWMLGARAALGR